jgi:sugar/nucleoside kinase (ribokinase family)
MRALRASGKLAGSNGRSIWLDRGCAIREALGQTPLKDMSQMPQKKYDVTCIGHAIVDVLAQTDDAFLAKHGIAKGGMTLIDAFRAETLSAEMRSPVEASGGSAGNTAVGIASLGGKAAFIGKVHEDRLGEVYMEDMARVGVDFTGKPTAKGQPTARSMIMVTPDGQRSMNTYLGSSSAIEASDIDEAAIAASSIFFVEGYLWDGAETKSAIRKGMDAARKAGTKIAFTLSDSFCVGRWRKEFLELIARDIDILFANEDEAKSLYETTDFDVAFQKLRAWGKTAAVTRSDKGSIAVSHGAVHLIDAAPIDKLVDTTGAGDLYAAGFLFGMARGLSLPVSGKLASLAAAECIQHIGPRPPSSLKAVAAERGLI